MGDLDNIVKNVKGSGQPPVHLWKPELSGDIDIQIDTQGVWFHKGDVIARESLVKLFSNVLWFEDGDYYLITPVEKWRLQVDDVPFTIVSTDLEDGQWVVRNNVGTEVVVDEEHPVELRLYDGLWLPYVKMRYELWARVGRNVYMEWVNAALEQEGDEPVLQSGDYTFSVGKV